MGKFSKKVGRESRNAHRKMQDKMAYMSEKSACRVQENANTVAKLLERSEPIMQKRIIQQCFQQVFAMSYMALHDEFGFGKKRVKKWYKRMLEIQHEALTGGSKTPYEDMLVALADDYNFDLNEAMDEVNAELNKEWYGTATP
ncbi:hypothetical protein SELR_18410 [Selenomonas ruminantium subsp. lactilytica TAM6421]|uniref:Uncharacterized protein n=1 Tax=Selenomonas ruminantium subsp. lactilytica (strain NBRC 103574 / TAM6421) TaxID=927704 RepID=I0GS12_SELRL|nr:hypothetical protein [Selenomonas ruminantium]BAL83549.1 hypothetical protein SELR_18410 [Selenomonas ruminantium subsp. lactilytica TAM6421]